MEGHEQKKVDAEEVAKALKELPEEVQRKIFYMIEGARLIEGTKQQTVSV